MANLIKSLRFTTPNSGHRYILDANIWIFNLNPAAKLTPYQQGYIKFVDALSNAGGTVVLPALVLSEVVNRMTRISMAEFFIKNPSKGAGLRGDSELFKKGYRPDKQYELDLKSMFIDIDSYNFNVELLEDKFSNIPVSEAFQCPPSTLDYNDSLIIKLAKREGLTIVTDDADFFVQDVNILTLNNRLLNK